MLIALDTLVHIYILIGNVSSFIVIDECCTSLQLKKVCGGQCFVEAEMLCRLSD